MMASGVLEFDPGLPVTKCVFEFVGGLDATDVEAIVDVGSLDFEIAFRCMMDGFVRDFPGSLECGRAGVELPEVGVERRSVEFVLEDEPVILWNVWVFGRWSVVEVKVGNCGESREG
jgi:hypothetical protein